MRRYSPVGTLYFVSHDSDDNAAEKHVAATDAAVSLLTRPPGKPGTFVIDMHSSEFYVKAIKALPQ